jgi:multiple sugar transport system substrate-binding protein
MLRRKTFTALAGAVALVAGLATTTAFAQQATLRVFSGGANQRPDLMRKLFDQYQAKNPNVKIDIETGGATSELQRQYLSTVLNAKDSAIDIYMIDIVNPAQYFGAGWLEPLDAYLGKPADALKPYLPVYATSNVVDGKLAAMPAFADAMFMYYRKDLLDKHGVKEPRPGTSWPPRPPRSRRPRAMPTCRACRSRARRSRGRSAPSCCRTGARARTSMTPPAR